MLDSSKSKHLSEERSSGLYDPEYEHDNCGFGFIANIKNHKSHQIIKQALEILENLDHRGAVGADPLAGDGAGILIQVPDKILREEMSKENIVCQTTVDTALPWFSCLEMRWSKARCMESIEKTVAKEKLAF
ncbi:MAG: hypothetical protein CM15mP62_22440 [Rhodospirillaceae bacterium]|nr:MAG: hypothetical protein CM15mP62_22440 [Rhodospirillaceae bacterium]